MTPVLLLPTAYCIRTQHASHSYAVKQERVAALGVVSTKIHCFDPLMRGKVPISSDVVNSSRLVTCRLSNYIDTSLSRGWGRNRFEVSGVGGSDFQNY